MKYAKMRDFRSLKEIRILAGKKGTGQVVAGCHYSDQRNKIMAEDQAIQTARERGYTVSIENPESGEIEVIPALYRRAA